MNQEEQKELNRLSFDYMMRFQNEDRPPITPPVAARIGWAQGYLKGRSLDQDRLERYERLLRDVLDLTMIADGHPRGIKALIREALK